MTKLAPERQRAADALSVLGIQRREFSFERKPYGTSLRFNYPRTNQTMIEHIDKLAQHLHIILYPHSTENAFFSSSFYIADQTRKAGIVVSIATGLIPAHSLEHAHHIAAISRKIEQTRREERITQQGYDIHYDVEQLALFDEDAL